MLSGDLINSANRLTGAKPCATQIRLSSSKTQRSASIGLWISVGTIRKECGLIGGLIDIHAEQVHDPTELPFGGQHFKVDTPLAPESIDPTRHAIGKTHHFHRTIWWSNIQLALATFWQLDANVDGLIQL